MTGRLARTGNALLTVAAVAGAVCIAAAIAASVFHVGLILFRTGSMGPEIPAGSIALVREIPAAEARVGDVVTVDRPGALPVTHRVVSTRPDSGGRTELVLRGDANTRDDPAPYRVQQVRLVMASVPGGAQVIAGLSSPLFLGSATLAATALVAWAFWPRRSRGDGETTPGDEETTPGDRARHSRHSRHSTALSLLALGAAGGLAASCASLAASAPAEAADVVTAGRHLTLTSTTDPDAFSHLVPGVPVRWMVEVAATAPASGRFRLGLTASGVLASRLSVDAVSCDARWTVSGCPGAPDTLASATTAASLPASRADPLAAMPGDGHRWVAIDVTLRPSTPEPTGPPQPTVSTGSAEITLWVWGSGDEASTSTAASALADTGGTPPLLPLLCAGAAVAAGTVLAGFSRMRRRG